MPDVVLALHIRPQGTTALIAAYSGPAGSSMITWPGTSVCAKAHTPVVP